MTKCLLLFSGGLDSILSVKILKRQKIKVVPICFESYFFNCQPARKSAKNLGLKLMVIDFSKEHLEIIKKPKYGRGQGMNPCIDCHLLMIEKAKEITEKEKFDFLATGEVLGERPFSQNINALKLIEKEASLSGLILRPLSAKLLPETIPEKQGLVKREKLLAIQGKSRKPQLTLAKKFKIKEFPTPAGGCILTDLEYSKKLKELFEKVPNCDGNDCQILRKGRVFWENKNLFIVARNEKECQELKKFKKKKDLILEPKNFPGPAILIRSFGKKIKKDILKKAKNLILKYSKKLPPAPLFKHFPNVFMVSFREKVFKVVRKIPKGKVLTYKEVASLAEKPRAWRAVGNILNKNKDPKIPCHRVIKSDGEIGSYNQGIKKKIDLLKKEKAI